MRLELALIVGILFFCSWCAYIVARMNASVSPAESSSSAPLQNSNQATNWTAADSFIPDPYQQPNNQSHSLSQPALSASHQSQQHHFGASEPEAAWRQQQQQQQQMGAQAPYALAVGPQLQQPQPAVFYQRPNFTPISPQAQAVPPAPWQTYALPTRSASAASEPDASQFGPAPELLDAQAEQEQADYEDEDTAASDYVAPQQQPEETAGLDPESDEANNEADEEQGQPETGNELDELSQRRVFNELESDSHERDKDGNLLVTRRRHLINGKPAVGWRPRRPVAENDETNYAESARDNRRAEVRPAGQEEGDFRRLVGEFDREDELRKLRDAKETAQVLKGKVAPTSGQQAVGRAPIGSHISGRPQWSMAERLMRRGGALGGQKELVGAERKGIAGPQGGGVRAGGRRQRPVKLKGEKNKDKKKKKDEHEHRLQETLEQQQWDDDGATSADERPRGEPAAGSAADHDGEQEVSDIVEQDEEARHLEDLSRELMQNPQFAELTRRRRSMEAEEVEEESAASSFLPAQEAGSSPVDGGNEVDDDERPIAEPESGDAECERGCDAAAGGPSEERPQGEARDNLEDVLGSVGADEAPEKSAQMSPAHANRQDSSIVIDQIHSSGSRRPEAMNEQQQRPRRLDDSLDGSVTSESQGNKAAGEQEKLPSSSNRSGSEQIVSEIGSPLKRHALVQASGEQPAELVSGLEDMHVEILAQPPVAVGLGNFSAPLQQRQPLATAPLQPPGPSGLVEFPRVASPFASSSSKVGKKKKARKYSKKGSKLVDSKYKAARAYAKKQRSRQKKGQMHKKKRKSAKKLIAGAKHFAGSTHGLKKAHGRGMKGARKGSTYFKDKGYRKKGFKKAYHKLETGDHKTYFDEFRDKDHNRRWKDFDDKHKYSQRKKWAGKDVKHLKHHDLKEARGKASKSGRWKESAKSEHMKKANKYKKAKKVAKKSYSSEGTKKKKKKKKKKKER